MGTTERLVVDLPTEIVTVLREAVQRGDFGSESEALSAIIQAMRGGDAEIEENIVEIRQRVAEGLAEADADEVIDADVLFDELEVRYQATIAKSGQ